MNIINKVATLDKIHNIFVRYIYRSKLGKYCVLAVYHLGWLSNIKEEIINGYFQYRHTIEETERSPSEGITNDLKGLAKPLKDLNRIKDMKNEKIETDTDKKVPEATEEANQKAIEKSTKTDKVLKAAEKAHRKADNWSFRKDCTETNKLGHMTDLQTVLTWLVSTHGILFLFTPTEDDNFCKTQRELLGDCEFMLRRHGLIMAEIFEQGGGHVGIIQIDGDGCEYFRQQFHITPGQSKVILLSKDQHVRLASDTFVSERELIMRLEIDEIASEEADAAG